MVLHGIESEDDLDDHEVFMNFKLFNDIYSVLGRLGVVNPPSLLNTSILSEGIAKQLHAGNQSESKDTGSFSLESLKVP